MVKNIPEEEGRPIVMVSSRSLVYSASPLALEEFPELDDHPRRHLHRAPSAGSAG
ncbi:MAG: hypothetical protein IPN71_17135 [Fibrobacteres bacterium]|nr:hypothetical protein [Fibrobacterota bacterium]